MNALYTIESGKYDHIRLNYPNGDMGEFYTAKGCIKLGEQPEVATHTGVFNAVCCSMEGMDLQLGRLKAAIEETGGILCLTADYGNSDDMYEHKKDDSVAMGADGEPKPKTSHSLTPVPDIIYDPEYKGEYELELNSSLGISSWPATLMNLMGFVEPSDYDKSMLNLTK